MQKHAAPIKYWIGGFNRLATPPEFLATRSRRLLNS